MAGVPARAVQDNAIANETKGYDDRHQGDDSPYDYPIPTESIAHPNVENGNCKCCSREQDQDNEEVFAREPKASRRTRFAVKK